MHPHQTPVVTSPLNRSCCFVVPPWHARLLGSRTIAEPRCFRETPRRLSESRASSCMPPLCRPTHPSTEQCGSSQRCSRRPLERRLPRRNRTRSSSTDVLAGCVSPSPLLGGVPSPLLLELLLNPRTPPLITQNHPRSFLLCSKQTPSLLRPCTSGVDGAEASLLSLLFMLPTKPLLVLSVSMHRSSAPFINPFSFFLLPSNPP